MLTVRTSHACGDKLQTKNYFRYNTDHPHACGDKIILSADVPPTLGSSPRVWGQGEITHLKIANGRIIPTHVGTRSLSVLRPFYKKDHPHACGDKEKTEKSLFCGTGSSPRVWGQGIIGIIGCEHTGIIPTRVGTRMFYMRLMQKK